MTNFLSLLFYIKSLLERKLKAEKASNPEKIKENRVSTLSQIEK